MLKIKFNLLFGTTLSESIFIHIVTKIWNPRCSSFEGCNRLEIIFTFGIVQELDSGLDC